jgi:hypothetical protein
LYLRYFLLLRCQLLRGFCAEPAILRRRIKNLLIYYKKAHEI